MMIDYGEELSGGVGERRDANLVVDCDDLSEVLVVGLREIRPFIYMANMSLIPNAITGDAARRVLFVLIRDFGLSRNLDNLKDLDWMVKLDKVFLDSFMKKQKKEMGNSAIDPELGYGQKSTEDRADGVVSTRFGQYKKRESDDGVDVYSPSKIKLHGEDNGRGRIVELIGCDESQTVGLILIIDGKVLPVRVSKLGALMYKDAMRIEVLKKSIEKKQTPWGNDFNEEQIAEAQVDLDRLVNRNNADKIFLGQWDADGRESLPWGEKVGER